MLTKRTLITAKSESSYNTNAVPTPADDAVLVENLSVSFTGQKMYAQENVSKATLGQLAQIYGTTLIQLTFDVLVKGSGTAGTAPEFGPLLKACGLSETIVAVTSVTYAPDSDSTDSVTIGFYDDGHYYEATGSRGAINFNAPSAEPGRLSLTFTGHLVEPVDLAIANDAVFDNTIAPVFKNAGFTVDSYAAIVPALAFDLGNEISMPVDINGADGYGEITITGRKPTGSFEPEGVSLATRNFFNDWKNGTEMAVTTGVIGAVAGNKWQLSMPAIVYNDMGFSDRDGRRAYAMPFDMVESAGDDQFSLVLT